MGFNATARRNYDTSTIFYSIKDRIFASLSLTV